MCSFLLSRSAFKKIEMILEGNENNLTQILLEKCRSELNNEGLLVNLILHDTDCLFENLKTHFIPKICILKLREYQNIEW